MRKLLTTVVFTALGAATSANAYQTSSGWDLLELGAAPPSPTTIAGKAEQDFFSKLQTAGVTRSGTETFETAKAPNLDFQLLGTATLEGTGNLQNTNADGLALRQYGLNNSRYWSTVAKRSTKPDTFTIQFSRLISGLGFYGIDLGDAGGSLELELFAGGSQIATVSVREPNPGEADGNTLYFGLLAQTTNELFDRVRFVFKADPTNNDEAAQDTFAFDNMTIAGDINTPPPGTIPEPASLALVGAALLGLRSARRRA